MKPSEVPSSNSNKMLLIGDSGAGKSGSVLELANAGYTLRVADFDNKFADLALKSGIVRPECMDNIDVIPFRGPKGKSRQALTDYKKAIEGWEDKGPIESWPQDVIFFLDSLTFMEEAMMNKVRYLNPTSKSGGQAHGMVLYGKGQEMLKEELSHLTSSDISCHVIIAGHLQYLDIQIEIDGKIKTRTKAYVKGIGKKLSPFIGAYFNTMLEVSTRTIRTQPNSVIDLKVPIMEKDGLKKSYPISSGLPEIFKLLEKKA